MTKPPRELLEFLRRHDADVRSLALGLRSLVIQETAPCHEYIFAMRSAIVLLYGPTDRVLEDCICMIGVYRKHANLQFTHGVDLDDSFAALRGSGARMRHLTIRKLSELQRPEIRDYLRQAWKLEGLTRTGQGKPSDVVTVVKPRPTTRAERPTKDQRPTTTKPSRAASLPSSPASFLSSAPSGRSRSAPSRSRRPPASRR